MSDDANNINTIFEQLFEHHVINITRNRCYHVKAELILV